MLNLTEPHEVLSERIEELFDIQFQTADIGDTSDASEGLSASADKVGPKHELSPLFAGMLDSAPRKTEVLPPLVKTAQFQNINERSSSALSRNHHDLPASSKSKQETNNTPQRIRHGLPSFNRERSLIMSNRMQRGGVRASLTTSKFATLDKVDAGLFEKKKCP